MRKPLFLVGMMGCGKSTMGRLLAGRLNAPFVDLDEEIVRFEGRTIPEIFADSGDAGFRVLESAALRRVCVNYKAQIPTFEEVAGRLGLRELPQREKAGDAEKDAKAAARAERRTRKTRGS